MGLRPSVPIWNGVRTLPSYTLFGLANVVIGARQTTG